MHIALFLPNWVGDVVMATPAVRAVREHYPEARIVGVCRPYVADVLTGSPWLDHTILYDPRGPKEIRTFQAVTHLRRESIDVAVLFPNSFRSALIARMGGCRRRIGYARYGRSWLLTDPLEPVRNEHGKLKPSPIIRAYNQLVEVIRAEPTLDMQLFATPDDNAHAFSVWNTLGLRGKHVVAFNPGAAFGASKLWPVEHFAELARKLIDERGVHVLVLCGPGQEHLATSIVERTGRPEIVSLAGQQLSLGLLKMCIAWSELLITTDSGPRHFAAALGRPVVSLFGPTHIEWTDTFYGDEVHLQKKVDCGPCQKRKCPLDHRCMTTLAPDEVYHAASRFLHGGQRYAA